MALPTSRLILSAAIAFVAAPAAAQPADQSRYHVIDVGRENVSYVDEASLGREGPRRQAWMLRITRTPATVAGFTFRVSKVLFFVDCEKMTLHNETIVFWRIGEGEKQIDFGKQGSTKVVTPGTPGAAIADFTCKGILDPKLKDMPVLDQAKAVQAATLFFDKHPE